MRTLTLVSLENPHSVSLFWKPGSRNVAKKWTSMLVSPIDRIQEDFQKQVAAQEPHFYRFQPDLDASTVYIILKHSVGPYL